MVKMERHKCKLCSRSFSSGRALGGHMRSHLANLPLPPKTPQKHENRSRPPPPTPAPPCGGGGGGDSVEPSTCSDCSSASTNNEDQKGAVYGLRKNPKKSFRLADPLSLDAAGLVFVQDGESEAESIKKPTRKRSKRTRKMPVGKQLSSVTDHSNVELEQVSSASNTSPEEDLALCLIMLSRDVWSRSITTATTTNNNNTSNTSSDEYSHGSKVMNGNKSCCKKIKIDCCDNEEEEEEEVEVLEGFPRNVVVACSSTNKSVVDKKVHECPFCGKVFGSGQALGGHKRSHLLGSTTAATTTTTASVSHSAKTAATTTTTASVSHSAKIGSESLLLPTSNSAKFQRGMFVIDLNLPAPMEEDEEEEEENQQHHHHHHGRNEQGIFRQEGSAVLRS